VIAADLTRRVTLIDADADAATARDPEWCIECAFGLPFAALMPHFKRILVANRGEIALRVIRTAEEMGIETVAVYSDADRTAMHVRRATHAVHLGGSKPAESYLDIGKVVDAAKRTGCDALHPGYGFLSENEDAAQACIDQRIEFLGPPPNAIRSMGDKVEARKIAMKAGAPIVPGLQEEVDEKRLAAAAKQVGYPVMLKAAAGGGGKGIRIVREESSCSKRSISRAPRRRARSATTASTSRSS
jgi:acetyl/propionyl-CoA carboxylase alpha subunit